MSTRNQIIYSQWTFQDEDIQSGNIYVSMSLMSDALEANTFSATVECADSSIIDFERNTPLTYSYKGRQVGIFYVQSITRDGPTTYTISATSAIGLLIEGLHYGGIYTGQTVAEVLPSICGTVPYVVKTNLRDIALYGWLPVASPRDNLSQVLFAIGASLKTDLDGVLHIESLWDGISGTFPRDRMYQGASVDYEAKVTQVVVTEHQYIQGGEEKDLFDGAAQEGDIITFDEPMHNLQATGFTILESGANYAKVSSGSGTLKGNAYIHNTRQISQDVLTANEPNVVTVTDATLVSLVNSMAVTQRVANYYKSFQTINADAAYEGEAPGDLLSTWHPYDQEAISACLESSDISLSKSLKAAENLLVGFRPVAPEQSYFDATERITQSGQWVVPDGVTHIRAVIIGGGQAGWTGLSGSYPEEASEVNETTEVTASITYTKGRPSVLGGEGGEPGEGGSPGKVYIVDLDVSPGQVFDVSIGTGGEGVEPSGNESVAGSLGTDTTFGSYSSAMGSSNPSGWLEETSGEVLAAKGESGIKGGSGSGRQYISGEGWQPVVNGNIVTDGTSQWEPGENDESSISDSGGNYNSGKFGYGEAKAEGGYGGGAAYGANGHDGNPASTGYAGVSDTGSSLTMSATGARGGAGADASPCPDQTVIGAGGRGGNGGGGGGSPGTSTTSNRLKKSAGQSQGRMFCNPVYDQCPGGAGSKGSKGGPGGVILYYSKPQEESSGPLVDSNNKYLLDKFGRRLVV